MNDEKTRETRFLSTLSKLKRKVTSENLKSVLRLSVTEEQKKVYPRSNAYSIAEGHYPVGVQPW